LGDLLRELAGFTGKVANDRGAQTLECFSNRHIDGSRASWSGRLNLGFGDEEGNEFGIFAGFGLSICVFSDFKDAIYELVVFEVIALARKDSA
jgi:hypothetical protein